MQDLQSDYKDSNHPVLEPEPHEIWSIIMQQKRIEPFIVVIQLNKYGC
jgi:hypothetical protein